MPTLLMMSESYKGFRTCSETTGNAAETHISPNKAVRVDFPCLCLRTRLENYEFFTQTHSFTTGIS